jgi:site-specific recombinase XerD
MTSQLVIELSEPATPEPPAIVPAPTRANVPAGGQALQLPSLVFSGEVLPLPHLVTDAGAQAARRYLEFFTVNIRNENTRAAYSHACAQFLAWCEAHGVQELGRIEPMMVATYIEQQTKERAPQTVKQHLAGIRMLFDWLVIGQVVPTNPAHSVRGPKYSIKKGKTPVLSREDTRRLLESIDTSHVVGLRDRALIGLMVYSFARVGAVVGLKVEDYYANGKRWWVRLHEKGGKEHDLPVHHIAEVYLDAYLDAAGIRSEPKSPLFRTSRGRSRQLTANGLQEAEALQLVKRRAADAGLPATICNHTFRATGITAYLENGGQIEHAQNIAAHESPRTTKLYDRRGDQVSLDEIERIVI